MNFGKNLQFLRKLHNGMTQEELAERVGVSRQTVSKWELDAALPEMEKAIGLCAVFSCTLDDLLVNSISTDNPAYSRLRTERLPAMRYFRYAVISPEPEDDAEKHVRGMAARMGIENPNLIGWDFPFLSQEQVNVFHMHGYASACILPESFGDCPEAVPQPEQEYAVITITEPFNSPFVLIPNAYETLRRYMRANGLRHRESESILPCFERVYEADGTTFMDVYIAIDS